METSETIIKAMSKAGKPLKCGEIAALSKLDKKIVDKSLKELAKNGKVFSPQRCYYAIKK